MNERTAVYELLNSQLIAIFDGLLAKRPDLLEEIPEGAVVIMQIKGEEAFNAWARRITEDEESVRPRLYLQFAFKTPVKPRAKRPLSWAQVKELDLQPVG
ncbi:MAG TPA: hypothetical protein ENI60_02730 [Candidatus Fraserbacteria bacterium]|nr:hypothetical protein [Candidatus Fraserbacteria bacterium]